MKNKRRLGLLLSLLIATTALVGCNNNQEKEKEISEEMVTSIINDSNIQAEVEVGEYESMLTGDVVDIPEDAQLSTSSTVFDAPRDYETTIVYNDNGDLPSLQNITNLLSDIKNANNELQTITIKDRGGKVEAKNLLTLSNAGTELKISNPNGYEYGEVYQIEINNAPYLSFKDKSDSIRMLTIEIEDDPSEAATYDDKQLKSNITDIDINKVSNKKENQELEIFTFDYEGVFPTLTRGDIFFVRGKEMNEYFDFYGEYQEKETLDENHERIIYTAPSLDQIYDSFHMKDSQPINVENGEILINNELAVDKFKQSGIARGLVKGLLGPTNNDVEQVKGIMDDIALHLNVSMVNNRLSTKFGLSISNIQIGKRWFFSFDIGVEKVTDYTLDFDVNIRTKWIFPTGVDYKVKCIEESQEGFYVSVAFTRALQPDRSRDAEAEQEFKKTIEEEAKKMKEGKSTEYAWGDDELKPSTSGSRTTWPIIQVNIYYFLPITARIQADFYIDAAFQIDLLVKKETFTTKIDFNFTNMSGSGQDTQTRVHKESNWVFALCGSLSFEVGFKVSFSLSISGMYDIIRVQAFAEWYVNLSATGMLILDISVSEAPTRVTGYIGLDLAITAGVRVGLNLKILFVEETLNKVLWFDYLFRIKWENSIEHFSPIADTTVEMDGIQNKKIDDTGILWLSTFNTITMSLQEKKMKANDKFSIFSGRMCPQSLEDLTGDPIFTFEVTDPSLIEINDGVIRVKDGTPNEFTTTFKVHVSNWAGTASDQTVSVHFIARDTKEVYVDNVLIGEYRPGYKFTLPEGPFIYGKEFKAYINNGNEYQVGEEFTMSDSTLHFIGKYRVLPYYFVYFVDGLGNVVSEQRIMEGESAIEPMAAMRDRFMDKDKYTFICWSTDFSKVMHDLVINSLYLEVK